MTTALFNRTVLGKRRFNIQRFGVIAIISLLLLSAKQIFAHPLGNFSVNRYSRIEFGSNSLELLYIVDMAEIPALQNRPNIDTNRDDVLSPVEIDAYAAASIAKILNNLEITSSGAEISFRAHTHTLAFPVGEGGLKTERLEVWYSAELPLKTGTFTYADNNFSDRLGWQEIVVNASKTVALSNSTATAEDRSQALTVYPSNMLDQPLTVQTVTFDFQPASGIVSDIDTQGQPPISTIAQPLKQYSSDGFADLIATPDMTPRVVVIALIVAFGLGAGHALTPGHGKTIVAAYLVGSRGTLKHAIVLGLTTTVTHTAGVFVLGLIVLFASRFILPETLFPWLSVFSGILVLAIGRSLLQRHWHSWRGNSHAHSHFHGHADEHDDTHTHLGSTHCHLPPEDTELSWRSLFALGISGGIIPCPSALVAMLSAIALQRIGLGLLFITIFSLGLASVLTLLGIVFVYAGRRFEETASNGNMLFRLLPIASAAFVTLAGFGITLKALLDIGILA